MENYYAQSIAQTVESLQSRITGLSTEEAKNRLKQFGPNNLPKAHEKVTRFKIFLAQFSSPLILILISAGIISGVLREFIDMTVIFMTVIVNVFVGFFQEDRANRALEKLQQMVEYFALVQRDGRRVRISSAELVPGDIVHIEAGDKIQADARIIDANAFLVNESALTGESEPIAKHTKKIDTKLPLADRKNMVYRGTIAINGRATILVTATGKETELGKIASLVQETTDEKTPLQMQLQRLGKIIGIVVVCISIGVFALGLLTPSEHHTVWEMFETAVAIAVAAIPEGLVISMTVILAIGMQHILKRNALVRKLVAAETLGSVSVICTDKTGTLTQGNMNVTYVATAHEEMVGSELDALTLDHENIHEDIFFALKIGTLCNDGILENPEKAEKDWKFVGDTTDTAFIKRGMKIGLQKHMLDTAFVRVGEIPFDSDNKFMATLHRVDHESLLYVKGAAEKLYEHCSHFEHHGTAKAMTQTQLDWFVRKEHELASQGLRVLAVAYKVYEQKKVKVHTKDLEELVFVGLVGLSDPLRPDVADTISIAQKAGIRVVIITGDHVKTAQTIAKQLHIPNGSEHVYDGAQLDNISDEKLTNILQIASIFARVDPKHKIRIVQALQKDGEVVAMTGDGVNDAPALKGADIGVALGSGTDVAKEIADVVLLDDSFNTIVAAIEEGRGMYQNIKKIILYLFAGSFAEVLLVVGALVIGLPLPVLPVQILWVNLIQDSLPNMALAFEKGERENMKDKPRRRTEPLFGHEMKILVSVFTIVINIILFAIYYYYLNTTHDLQLTRTIVFVGLAIGCLLYVYSVRSLRHPLWRTRFFDNKLLNVAVLLGWALLISAVYFPPFQYLLRTVPLLLEHWIVLLLFGVLNVIIIEITKTIFFNKKYNQSE